MSSIKFQILISFHKYIEIINIESNDDFNLTKSKYNEHQFLGYTKYA